jgi:hypothetical protein
MTTQAASISLTRPLALLGLIAVGGLPTFVITIVLGSIGFSFVVSGLAVFTAGLLAAAGVVQTDDPPIYAILVGPPLAGAGVIAFAMLVGYLWLAAKVVRRVLTA